MSVYIDSEFKCHTTNPDGVYEEIESEFFDNKCDEFIEGFRYIPSGESWTREDGVIFTGEMITPWKSYSELDSAQLTHEYNLISEYSTALAEIEAALSVPEVRATMSDIVEKRRQNIISCINETIKTLIAASSTD